MNKISGILPPSARIQSTDFADAHAVRPGMPTFGAPQGKSSLAPVDRVSFSSLRQPQWKNRDLEKADVVTQLTNNFFNTRTDREPEIVEAAMPAQEEIMMVPTTVIVLPSDEYMPDAAEDETFVAPVEVEPAAYSPYDAAEPAVPDEGYEPLDVYA